jgi:nitroreductase
MPAANLSPDELLTTTRAVRKRLNLEKPVPITLVHECIEIALQAPTGGNTQSWQFMIVTDPALRSQLADLYRSAWDKYRGAPGSVYDLATKETESQRKQQHQRVISSAEYLVEHLQDVPVHLIPCMRGRNDQMTGDYANAVHSSSYGSIIPAAWSYMLAARSRGLGTAWTTAHLFHEREAAELLGIPYDNYTQVALIPTAWYTGETFRASLRRAVADVVHENTWSAP